MIASGLGIGMAMCSNFATWLPPCFEFRPGTRLTVTFECSRHHKTVIFIDKVDAKLTVSMCS